MPKNRIPSDLQVWIDARKRFHLSHAHVQMARELGMNPKKLGKLANHKQEPWKVPLPQFIEHLYHKRFGKERPDVVRSIEERARQTAAKKAAQREADRREANKRARIAWFLPEQWEKLRAIAADQESLGPTYAEWLLNAENAQAQKRAAGKNAERVIVDVDELYAWCRSRGWVVNRKSRTRFVAHLLLTREAPKESERVEQVEADDPSESKVVTTPEVRNHKSQI